MTDPRDTLRKDTIVSRNPHPDIQAARAALQQLLATVDKPRRFPEQPPIGSVLRFERTFRPGSHARSYDYVAFRAEPGWYFTSARSEGVLTWEQMVECIGDNPCWLVSEYIQIPHLPTEQHSDVDNPRAWYRAVYGEEGDTGIGPEPYNPGGYMDGSRDDWGGEDF